MAVSPASFDFIRMLLADHSAIALADKKTYLVETRLLPVARRAGLSSVDDLVKRLRVAPNHLLRQQVIDAMTTNETSFFRDKVPFETLRSIILTDLLERRVVSRNINIWSAGCACGQEPYSVAMLLWEHFPILKGWKLNFIASDISYEVLKRAGMGRYTQLEVNRGLPAVMLVKYFQKQGLDWQIKEEIRQMIAFRFINLHEPWPSLPNMDIIFMRNVLIYFDVETKKSILGRIRRLLNPDGYLFLGGAETTLNLDEAFKRVHINKSSCYQLQDS